MSELKIFAACPVYLEDLLEEEILREGGKILRRSIGGHLFECGLENVYRLLLHSRVASRILLFLKEFDLETADDIYRASAGFPWHTVMEQDSTFACFSTSSGKTAINPRTSALKVKDGVADFWRDRTGERPNVDREHPDIGVHIHIQNGKGILYLDLSGEGLHRRGYRLDSGRAGLRENTAASLLLRAGWKDIARKGGILVDPMCGSGTLLVEAAMIAADLPANLHRHHYGFFGWKGHDPDLWETVFDEAERQWEERLQDVPVIIGYDCDKDAVRASLENIKRAGLTGRIHLEKKDLEDFVITEKMKSSAGLIITNPPYGQRIGDKASLYTLYRQLGDLARKQEFSGWNMSVISDDEGLLRSVGLKASRKNKIMNGPISCFLYHYELFGGREMASGKSHPEKETVKETAPEALSMEAEQFLNRLRKNRKNLRKWIRKEEIGCYRLYDADLPNFNFAIDVYEGKWIHIQEYAPPATVEREKADRRLKQAVSIMADLMEVPRSSVFIKQRRRQKGNRQYEKNTRQGEKFLVNEWDVRFWVNFTDYLDTGIFLDHRNIRRYIKENSRDRSVLNLFCYTGTASVMAAAGGASRVTSVDTSSTYLKWAEENFRLNKLSTVTSDFVKSDTEQWLRKQGRNYDLIFMDPPTFSNSKSRLNILDIQRDHPELISLAMDRLNPGGLLIFSNNYSRFEMDAAILDRFQVKEVTDWTRSPDFIHKGASHRCWFITSREE